MSKKKNQAVMRDCEHLMPVQEATETPEPAIQAECCAVCRHWINRMAGTLIPTGCLGGCHRLPPVICITNGPMLSGRERYLGTWPITLGSDHCGEFSAR